MVAFEHIMKYFRAHKQEVKVSLHSQKQSTVEELQYKIDSLVKKCLTATSPALIAWYEKKISILEEERKLFEAEIVEDTDEKQEDDFAHHFDKIKAVIQSPIWVRNMGQMELKRMLINTLFEGTLTYSKELDIIQTTKIPAIYNIFHSIDAEFDPYNIKSFFNNLLNEKSPIYGTQTNNELLADYVLNQNCSMVGDIDWTP